ncbi:MAG: hypothetical protein LBC68_12045 [Prevotellaceae bacterium]|jgi:hypothetical protein|nr:hypothetical protein [Prevotellaceae bacterium]
MKYIDSCDWIQISFNRQSDFFSCKSPVTEEYLLEFQTTSNIFASINKIVKKATNEVVGILCHTPVGNLKNLGENFCTIKFKNRDIYFNNVNQLLEDFKICFSFKEYNIIRLDLCRDFRKFKNGLLPQTFIRNVFNEKYVIEGKTGKFFSKGRFASSTYYELLDAFQELAKKQGFDEMEFIKESKEDKIQTLRIGNRSLPIYKILYNKTEEMRTKNHKPYITELHEKYLDDDGDGDVWRLEFSLKRNVLNYIDSRFANEYIDSTTGNIGAKKLQIKHLTQENITLIMDFLVAKKFSWFIRKDTLIDNKVRDWKRLELFDKQYIKDLPIQLCIEDSLSDCNRAFKTFLKQFVLLDTTMRSWKDLDEAETGIKQEVLETVMTVIANHLAKEKDIVPFMEKVLANKNKYHINDPPK